MSKMMSYGKRLGKEFKEDRATGLAAEQAYYYMLSIFPMLILLLSILPYLQIDPQQAIKFLESVMPSGTAKTFEKQVVNIVSSKNGGLLTFGIIGTIWSASNGMKAFMTSMNKAYDVDETRSFIKKRLIAILLTLGMIIALVVALLLPVFGNVIMDLVKSIMPMPNQMEIVFSVLRWVVAIIVMAAILTALYRFAPNKHFKIKHVIPGAIIATVLWQLVSLGFSFYVSNFGSYSETYGSLGGVIVLMLWFFLTGLVLVLGGEINALFHKYKRDRDSSQNDGRTVTT
ncbi:YihY/virulence factor BrkB family protein [Bacillus marinisedimentorum]|uniref:YihY/virulence factor BrkB family protein n=1 Tax=Bacillus marinisedimentorum TaxID=1821260 RepID=UPI000871E599|nr:YihY/virulence factor BrkB family protein [Bacillus marinisedimentorum]